jgi:hypothetical protein
MKMKKQATQIKKKRVVYAVQPHEKMSSSLLDAYQMGDLYPTEIYLSKKAAQRAANEYNYTFGDDEPAEVRELTVKG